MMANCIPLDLIVPFQFYMRHTRDVENLAQPISKIKEISGGRTSE